MKRQTLRLFLPLSFGLCLAGPALAAEPAGEKTEAVAAGPKCLIAEINPVTGSVYCIKPPGAPVDPPPAADSPCRQDPRMKGQWTWGPNCKP